MIDRKLVPQIFHDQVYDPAGHRLGRIEQVYLDDRSGEPVWASVRRFALFGHGDAFVPIDQAEVRGNTVRVPVHRSQVRSAPRVQAEGGHMSGQQEQELYDYYGVAYPSVPTQQGRAPGQQAPGAPQGPPPAGGGPETGGQAATGRAADVGRQAGPTQQPGPGQQPDAGQQGGRHGWFARHGQQGRHERGVPQTKWQRRHQG
ncbi:PRC-barrel domain-containing protein [Goodfellowiella coeruleoviolacea]|uniref:PRC-barrel domain-containing protein n=1 Tax=Goodfellowiella coeruleoviolacea TaxID=334858 RepID=A0AAE3KMT6_9PSEU|nr:PRC-barrel domain-containing protein [Goodfellowiella coeruleoviolacea]MCP2167993.1 PRC-barrel domain-containing protein [Goodfellowiella coeruleoviolacea]